MIWATFESTQVLAAGTRPATNRSSIIGKWNILGTTGNHASMPDERTNTFSGSIVVRDDSSKQFDLKSGNDSFPLLVAIWRQKIQDGVT